MYKRKLLLTLFFLVALYSFSQMPDIVWQQCYGSPEMDKSYGIVTTGNGYLLAIHLGDYEPGVTNYHGMGDIWILNTDSTGTIIWEKCFGGSSGDVPQKIIKKSENEFFIYGYTFSTDGDVQSGNNGHSDLWVVKINSQGDIIWENTYGCTGIDDARDMILTPDGGFIMIDRIGIGGGDVTNFYGSGDVWMCKCDSLGNIEWEKTLGNDGLDNCVSMIMNSENNIMMIGAAQKHGGLVECYPDEVWGDVWLVELDLQGNIVSQHCYGGSAYEVGFDVMEVDDGYIFTAHTDSNDGDVSGLHGPSGGLPNGYSDIWVVKLNDQFEIFWQKCIGGYDTEDPKFISQTDDGGYTVIGTTYSNDGDVSGNHSNPGWDTDIWAVKLDSLGEIEWQQCYGGWGSERLENPHTILKKEDYNYVIASSTDFGPSYDVGCTPTGGNAVDRDAWIFEIDLEDTTDIFDAYGKQDNIIKVYPNPARDYVIFELPATAQLKSTVFPKNGVIQNNTVISNSTVISTAGRNPPTAWESANKNKPANGRPPNSKGVSHSTAQSQPKGFDKTGSDDGAVVEVFDVFGQTVQVLQVKAEKTVWDCRQTKNGIYFYKVEIEGEVYSGKVVVQK